MLSGCDTTTPNCPFDKILKRNLYRKESLVWEIWAWLWVLGARVFWPVFLPWWASFLVLPEWCLGLSVSSVGLVSLPSCSFLSLPWAP